jgi:hypothetical protein
MPGRSSFRRKFAEAHDASPPDEKPCDLFDKWLGTEACYGGALGDVYFAFLLKHCWRNSAVASLLQSALFSCLRWAHSLRAFGSEMALQSTLALVLCFMHSCRA